MFFTTHIITGAAIGLVTGNPYASFFAGIASHHILDRIPHFDVGSFYVGKAEPKLFSDLKRLEKALVVVDLIIGVGLFVWLLKMTFNPLPDIYIGELWTKDNSLVTFGSLGAVLPDIIYTLSHSGQKRLDWLVNGNPIRYYHRFHQWFHQVIAIKYWHISLLTQAILIWLSVWVLLNQTKIS